MSSRTSFKGPEADLVSVFSVLVNQALKEGDPDRAYEWLDRGREIAPDPDSWRTFTMWSAAIRARDAEPEAALVAYQSVIEREGPRAGAVSALQGAETLIDNRHFHHAFVLLRQALELARATDNQGVIARVEHLVHQYSSAME